MGRHDCEAGAITKLLKEHGFTMIENSATTLCDLLPKNGSEASGFLQESFASKPTKSFP